MHKRIQLNNGLVVAYEKIEGYKSVSIGVWIKVGSAFESSKTNGLSHFIEHMVFKGTSNRTAKKIAMDIDGVGGEINAYTAKECTCYYVKVLGEHLALGLDVLSDIVLSPLFQEDHIELERAVIADEIAMYEDTPEEVVSDLLCEVTFKKHPLGYPILGQKHKILGYQRQDLLDFYQTYYCPSNMVLSIAGDIDEDQMLQYVNTYFGSGEQRAYVSSLPSETASFHAGLKHYKKDIEQVHVMLDFPGVAFDHDLSYEMSLMSNILGGANSSRLFQKVREESGLTYSIYSEPTFYDSIGTLSIGFAVSKENVEETLSLVFAEIQKIKVEKLTDDDVMHSKKQLRGSVILGLEGSDHYMDLIGRTELFAHAEKNIDDMLSKIDKITTERVNRVIDICFSKGEFSMAVVGDIDVAQLKKIYSQYRGGHYEN